MSKRTITVDLTDGPLAGQNKAAWQEKSVLAWTRKVGDEWFLDAYYRVGVLRYKHLRTFSGINPDLGWEEWKLPEDAMPPSEPTPDPPSV